MNASNEYTTDLIELAQASWNSDFLVPCKPELFGTRPLMVLSQSVYDQPRSASIDDIRRSAQEQLSHTASLSHYIETLEGVSVLFVAEFGDDPTLINALHGEDCEQHVATDLRAAVDLTAPPSFEDSEIEGEPLRPQHLWTIVVLPEDTAQHIDLESIQDAIPDFTGKAYWYDPSDDIVKVQAWEEGDLDTGYLWALQEDEDAEDYTIDAAPGRALFAKLSAGSK